MAVERLVFLRFASNVGSLAGDMSAFAGSMTKVEEAYASQAISAQKAALSIEQANIRVETSQKRLTEVMVSGSGSIAAAQGAVAEAEVAQSKAILDANAKVEASAKSVAAAEEASGTARAEAASALNNKLLIGSAAIIGGFGLMAKAAVAFEQEMKNAASVSEYTQTHFQEMSQEILGLSTKFPISAKDFSNALVTVEQAGLNGDKAIQALTVSAKSAVGNFTDIGTTTKVMAVLIHDYGLSLEQASNDMNILTVAHQRGLGSFQAITQGVITAAPVAATLGVRFEEVAAGIASMTRAGVPANMAGQTLQRTLLQLEKDSASSGKALRAAFESMGVDSGKAAIAAFGLQGTLQRLFDSWKAGNVDLVQIFPQIRSFRGIAAEAADGGKLYADILKEMSDKTKTAAAAQKAYETQQGSFQNQLKILKNDVQALAISWGQAVIPAFRTALEVLKPLVEGLAAIPAPIKSVIALGAVLVAGFAAIAAGIRIVQSTWTTFSGSIKTASNFWKEHSGSVKADSESIAENKTITAEATAQIEADTKALEENTIARRANTSTPVAAAPAPIAGGGLSQGEAAAAGQLSLFGKESAAATRQLTLFETEAEASPGLFSRMGSAIGAAGSRLGEFATSAGGVLASMGPMIAVVGAATLILSTWASEAQKAKRFTDEQTSAVEALTQAFQAEAAGSEGSVRDAVAQQIVHQGVIDTFNKYKVNVNDVVDALNGSKEAQDRVNASFTSAKDKTDVQALGVDRVTKALRGNKDALKELSAVDSKPGFIDQFFGGGANTLIPQSGLDPTTLNGSERALAKLIVTIGNLPAGTQKARAEALLLGQGINGVGNAAANAAPSIDQLRTSASLAAIGLKQASDAQTQMSDIISNNLTPASILSAAQKDLQDSTQAATTATKAQNTELYDQAHAILQDEQNARGLITAQRSLADAQKALNDLKSFGLQEQIDKQEIAAARAVTDHQKAVDDLAKAQKSLNDLLADQNKELEQAAEDQKKAELSVESAQLDLLDSARKLQYAQGGMPETQQKALIDYQEKILAVKDAQNSLTKAQKANADAKSGVTRAQELASAEDAIRQAELREKETTLALTDAQRALKDLRGQGGQQQVADAEDKVKAAVLGVKEAYQQLKDAQIQQHNQEQQILDEKAKAQKDATKTTQVTLEQWAAEEKKKVGDTSTFFEDIAKLARDGHTGLAQQLTALAKTNFDEANHLATQAVSTNQTTLRQLDEDFDTGSKMATDAVQNNIQQLIQILPFLSQQMSDAQLKNYIDGLIKGNNTVDQLTRQLSQQTVDSVNSVLKSFNLPQINYTPPPPPGQVPLYAAGTSNIVGSGSALGAGGQKRFAEGGVEDHVAQIAPGGSWRIWAEPETGGEAYIPLAESKRGRSEDILGKVADRFGYKLEKYADGAFNLPKVPTYNQGTLGTPELTETGNLIHDSAVNFLNSAIASLQTGEGLQGSGYRALIDYLQRMHVPFNMPTVNQTTGGGHVAGSLHYQGRAADFTSPNGPAGMMLIFNTFLRVAQELSELFYTPAGFSIKNHQRVAPIAAADHYSHVHAGIDPGTFSLSGGGAGQPGTPAQVEAWLRQAIGLTHVPDSWLAGLEIIAMHESSGNPHDVNNWDSNAKAGNPSEGLMQCVDMSAEILTREGWKKHDEVQVGDETIGYNPETGRSEWTKITKVVHSYGPVWEIGNSHWRVRVTPNHRWWSDTEHQIVTDLPTECPDCEYGGSSRGVAIHRGIKHGHRSLKETVHTGEFVRTDNLRRHHRIRLAAEADTEGIASITPGEAAILGWLMGDGHLRPVLAKPEVCPECGWLPGTGRKLQSTVVQKGNSVAVHRAKKHGLSKRETVGKPDGRWDGCIYQSKPEFVPVIRELLRGVPHGEGVRHRGRRKNGTEMWPSYAFRLAREYVSELIKRSQLMELGSELWVLSLDPEQRQAWLGAMIGAEGHDEEGHMRICQNNGDLQDAIKLAVFLEGYRPTTQPLKRYEAHHGEGAHIGMARPHVSPAAFSHHEELEEQEVWCVKTELETWTMRQDGRVMLTGNTTISTFNDNALPGHHDIFNPVDNAAAAIEYILHRYHDINNVPGVRSIQGGGKYKPYSEGGFHLASYDNGGYLPPGWTIAHNGTGMPEPVGGSAVNPVEVARVVADAVRVALENQTKVNVEVNASASQRSRDIADDIVWAMKTEGR